MLYLRCTRRWGGRSLERMEVEKRMPELPITYRGTVYPWHCDQMGHMNVMWYVGKFDEATWQLFNLLGLTPAYLRDKHRGMAAVEQRIAYRRELYAGDIVTVRSGVLEIREKVLRFFHEMRNEATGEIASVTLLTGVHMDTEARKACPFPAEALECAQAYIVEYDAGL